jgi:hypothetical protein
MIGLNFQSWWLIRALVKVVAAAGHDRAAGIWACYEPSAWNTFILRKSVGRETLWHPPSIHVHVPKLTRCLRSRLRIQ